MPWWLAELMAFKVVVIVLFAVAQSRTGRHTRGPRRCVAGHARGERATSGLGPPRQILRASERQAFRGAAEVAVARAKRGMTRNEYREDQFAALRQSHFQDASLTRYYALSEG